MKIGSSFKFSFKGNESTQPESVTKPENLNAITEKEMARPTIEQMRAYKMVTTSDKGIKNAVIVPDKDSYQLVCTLKAPQTNTEKIKLVYKLKNDENPRESFSTAKNPDNKEFSIKIPILNRKNNSVVPQLQIDSVEYFDDTNLKIGEETPENLILKPKEILKNNDIRFTNIEGKTSAGEFDSISEGTVAGKLVKMDYADVIRYKENEPIIAILSKNDMNEMFMQIAEGTFTLPMNVKGLIMSPPNYKQGYCMTDMLGHAVSRLRGRKIFALVDNEIMKNIEKNYYNNSENPYVKIELGMDKLKTTGLKELPKADTSKVNIPRYELVNELLSPEDDNYTPETVGLKAYNLGRLKSLQEEGNFNVPLFFVVPAGVWDYSKRASENERLYGEKTDDAAELGEYHYYSQKADASDYPETELKGIRRLIVEDMTIPKEIRTKLKEKAEQLFDTQAIKTGKGCLIARSSFNGEDSPAIATQGLYDSFPGIRTDENLFRGIKEVWASKWSDLAYMSRRNHKIPHRQIQPNVIVQDVVPVDYTFTAYTADPRSNNKNKIVVQLSQGVYSGFPNSPYVFEYNKTTGEITRTALATKKRTKPIDKVVMDDFSNLKYDFADYSNDPLNMDKEHYNPVMEKVFDVTKFIEEKFGGVPQDIEGGIIFKKDPETGEMKPEIHIWQTRDVHLLKR